MFAEGVEVSKKIAIFVLNRKFHNGMCEGVTIWRLLLLSFSPSGPRFLWCLVLVATPKNRGFVTRPHNHINIRCLCGPLSAVQCINAHFVRRGLAPPHRPRLIPAVLRGRTAHSLAS